MGFRNGAYARIWEKGVQTINYGEGQSFTKYWVRLSVRRKGPDDTFYQQFSGFCELKGDALKEMRGVKVPQEGLPVKLGNVDLDNSYDAEKETTYWNPIIWSFDHSEEEAPSHSEKKQNTKLSPGNNVTNDIDEDLPF